MRGAGALAGALLLAITALIAVPPARAELKPISPFAATEAAPPSAFGARPIAAPLQSRGLFGSIFAWVVDKQQTMQRTLAMSVKDLKSANPMAGALTLGALSFLYGILHAVGPGHGKTIISSYVVANEETVRRGVLISFIASAVQALTAVVLVSLLLFGLNASGLQINAWSIQLESVSYALIALVGLYLLATQLFRLWRGWRAPAGPVSEHQSSHGRADLEQHTHAHHAHDHHDHGHLHTHGHDHAHAHAHAHDHHHDQGHDDHHGHHHLPGEACNHIVDARDIAGPFSWRKVAAVVLSVGIRPCSGAILVLVFAVTQGLFWAGVAATFAMALGTAITVAALATATLGSRELALKLGGTGGRWANAVWTGCTIGGSLVILLFGTLLFAASLGPTRPF
jgi:nickel/cobalt transporter (NicO) family protein